MIYLTDIFFQTQIQHAGDRCVFKFLRRSVNGKHLMRFQSETSVFKSLRRSVNGKHLMRFQSETFVFKFLRRNVYEALVVLYRCYVENE